jgi:hypothetical protein
MKEAMTEQQAAEAAAEAMKAIASQHDDVSCNNTTLAVMATSKGDYASGLEVIQRCPIISKTSVMAMLSVPRECIGDKDQYLQPCGIIACVAAKLKAFMAPQTCVKLRKMVEMPIYRSMSGGGGGGEQAECAVPVIEIPQGTCVTNLDGSLMFTLKAAEFSLSREDLDAKVAAGEWPSQQAYYVAMHEACWNEFLRLLRENGVPLNYLFQCADEPDSDGNKVVEPWVVTQFMDLLYPNLVPGSDMIVCVPPFDADGNPKMDGAFNIRFSYDRMPKCIPVLGLHHNDEGSDEKTVVQAEDYWVVSNMDVCMMIGSETEKLPLSLGDADSYLPDTPDLPSTSNRHGFAPHLHNDLAEAGEWDYPAFIGACKQVQAQCSRDMLATYNGVIDEIQDSSSQKKVIGKGYSLYVTNLRNTRLYQTTNCAELYFGGMRKMMARIAVSNMGAKTFVKRSRDEKEDDPEVDPAKRTRADVPMDVN